MDLTATSTLRWWFLEDALVSLAEAEDLLVDGRRADAIDALFAALGLLSDAIDAASEPVVDDPAHTALDGATRALAAATRR